MRNALHLGRGAAVAVGLAAVASLALGGVANATTAATSVPTIGTEVSVQYHCLDDNTYWTFQWEIDTPAAAHVGDTITLGVSGDFGTNVEGVTIPADATTTNLAVNYEGTQTGTTEATGIVNQEAIPPGAQRIVSGGVATLTLTHPGVIAFSPGTLTGSDGPKTATCEVVGTAPVSSAVVVLP